MTRILISSPSGPTLEVEKTAFDAGFFPDYVYVRDASGSSVPYVPGYLDADIAAAVATPASATAAALKAAYVAGRACTTDGTNSLPAPTGVGLEFVITTTGGVAGLQDIRFNGTSL